MSQARRARYWRSEILEIIFWRRGQGHDDGVDGAILERYLGVEADIGIVYLERLVADGFLAQRDERFDLSDDGARRSAGVFLSSLAKLTKSPHGACRAGCWCQTTPDEADAWATIQADASAYSLSGIPR
jgi:hypothetical protein